jgi:8-oxo-dGTP diphosphatase
MTWMTDESVANTRRWHRRLASLLRRFPWSGRLAQRVYRLRLPRFTVGVVGVLLDENHEQVLLVEHIFHTRRPWGLPGGWLERGEDPAETVEREFLEETGLHVRAAQTLLVKIPADMRRHLDVVFLCKLADGTAPNVRLSHELIDYRWVTQDALPPLVAFHAEAIRLAFEGDGTQEVVVWNTDV